jgi:hypothetical protein
MKSILVCFVFWTERDIMIIPYKTEWNWQHC